MDITITIPDKLIQFVVSLPYSWWFIAGLAFYSIIILVRVSTTKGRYTLKGLYKRCNYAEILLGTLLIVIAWPVCLWVVISDCWSKAKQNEE